MKLVSIEINDFNPIKYLKLENLGDVVIIAGANGSGKTRLKQAIIQTLQQPSNPKINMKIKATRKEEKDKYFNGEYIEIKKGVSSIP
jgi:predicted ATP-binding protein involved in virulence